MSLKSGSADNQFSLSCLVLSCPVLICHFSLAPFILQQLLMEYIKFTDKNLLSSSWELEAKGRYNAHNFLPAVSNFYIRKMNVVDLNFEMDKNQNNVAVYR